MPADEVVLDSRTRERIVDTKITCPFLGSAVNEQILGVLSSAYDPLASIEDLRQLGNKGEGDLGDLLVLFAEGNHAFMRGGSGDALNTPVPAGLFSLELPGSQGAHHGHSGILEGDPEELDSGRLCVKSFDRLAGRAKEGFIRRSDVGHFIAENLRRDPASKVSGANVIGLLAEDLGALFKAVGPSLMSMLFEYDAGAAAATRVLEEKLTKLLGQDNLVGSAGEFGLLFAFLGRGPRTKELDGEPALSLEDLRTMFLDRHLPDNWGSWKKLRVDWAVHTASLIVSADREYRKLSQP